jgi:hypothetical protein
MLKKSVITISFLLITTSLYAMQQDAIKETIEETIKKSVPEFIEEWKKQNQPSFLSNHKTALLSTGIITLSGVGLYCGLRYFTNFATRRDAKRAMNKLIALHQKNSHGIKNALDCITIQSENLGKDIEQAHNCTTEVITIGSQLRDKIVQLEENNQLDRAKIYHVITKSTAQMNTAQERFETNCKTLWIKADTLQEEQKKAEQQTQKFIKTIHDFENKFIEDQENKQSLTQDTTILQTDNSKQLTMIQDQLKTIKENQQEQAHDLALLLAFTNHVGQQLGIESIANP